MYQAQEKTADLEDVRFYFDGVKSDSLDVSGISRRNSELLALRPHLYKLSELEFEAVIKAFWGSLSSIPQALDEKNDLPKSPQYSDAVKLYKDSQN